VLLFKKTEQRMLVSGLILVHKDAENQKKVPEIWKGVFREVVDALKDGDYQLARDITNVSTISEKVAMAIKGNIESYGEALISLPEETWNTSVCQWMVGYWDVLVDLFTEEGESDLVLSVRVRESSLGYLFDVHSVCVP